MLLLHFSEARRNLSSQIQIEMDFQDREVSPHMKDRIWIQAVTLSHTGGRNGKAFCKSEDKTWLYINRLLQPRCVSVRGLSCGSGNYTQIIWQLLAGKSVRNEFAVQFLATSVFTKALQVSQKSFQKIKSSSQFYSQSKHEFTERILDISFYQCRGNII